MADIETSCTVCGIDWILRYAALQETCEKALRDAIDALELANKQKDQIDLLSALVRDMAQEHCTENSGVDAGAVQCCYPCDAKIVLRKVEEGS